MLRRRLLLAFACLATVGIAPEARAQGTGSSSGSSTGGGSESINSPVPNPTRYLFQGGQYVDVTNNPRPQNLNPTGVNYTDCMQDLRLNFELNISGFSGSHIEVWAGTIDCTQDANRTGSGAGVSHVCWEVAGRTGPLNAVTTAPEPYTVYTRDVLRYEQIPASSTFSQAYQPTFHNSSQGETACKVQTSDAAVPINLYFIPVTSAEQASGTAWRYPLNTDLVGPPPPPTVTLQPGDSLLTVSWTSPGADPDIAGYAIWSDPPAGGATTGGCSCGSAPGNGANSYVGGDSAVSSTDGTIYRCIDAAPDAELDGELEGATDATSDALVEGAVEASMMEGAAPEASMPMPEASTDGASEAAAPEGGTDAGTGGAGDAGDAGMVNCNPINTGGGGACNSYYLTAGSWVVSGSGTTQPFEASTDDSGTSSGGGDAGEALSGGGIASIDPKYKGYELDDRIPSPITLTGLTNGHNYVVVVTTIDGSGNVGPVSTPQCGQPEPTSDFWKTYKSDNGSAAGCALEAGDGSSSDLPLFALGIGATAAAFLRRRRTRR
jgi:hypothetical protein